MTIRSATRIGAFSSTLSTVVLSAVLATTAQADSTKSLIEQSIVHNVKKEKARAIVRLAELGNEGAARNYYDMIDLKRAGIEARDSLKRENLALDQINSVLKNQLPDASSSQLLPTSFPNIYPSSLDPQTFAGTELPTSTTSKNYKKLFTSITPHAIGLYNPYVHNNARSLLFNLGESFISTVSSFDDARFLMIPEEALVRKIELLSGSRLPEHVIRNQTVDYPIDFSKAPKFKEILVSTLFLRADFTGTMFSRALIYHAGRGTKVRIMMSATALMGLHLGDSENKAKDERLFATLRNTPNVEMQEVKYIQHKYEPNITINQLHRAHHAKLIVMVGENSKDSRVIVGGRNLSDAYAFQTPPDHSEYPQLIQYKAVGYMPVEDMEVEIKGAELVSNAQAQFLVFWNREGVSYEFDQPFYHIPAAALADSKNLPLIRGGEDKNYIRHFWHAPFKDEKESNLETLFVTMVKSATKTIQIVTPYFNLPDRLAAALKEASTRGVKIIVLTNASLMGDDFLPGAVTAANKMGMRKMMDHIEFSTWDNPKVMLHTKMMLVDSQLLYVGSVNMNKRSFSHDVENGFLISGSKSVGGFLTAYYNRYKPVTKPLSKHDIMSGVSTFNKTLVNLFDELF